MKEQYYYYQIQISYCKNFRTQMNYCLCCESLLLLSSLPAGVQSFKRMNFMNCCFISILTEKVTGDRQGNGYGLWQV